MLYRVKLVDIELSHPLETIEGLDGYTTLKGLVRLHGTPLGYVQVPVMERCCTASALGRAILEQHNWPIIRHLLDDLLAGPPRLEGLRVGDLLHASHPAARDENLPYVTVAVCTRDRPDYLALCLDALNRLDYPHLDIVIVDNAPGTDATERLVRKYPAMRYVCEPRPGLDWARNRAIVEARGEIIAYTDDDVVVDTGWVRALAGVFAENPEVMAVTGLVVPHELETDAQSLFEQYSGFGRGFERKWYRLDRESSDLWKYYGAGQYGTGANMAYRRRLFDEIGYFDPALDVGTPTSGGGDLEMFFRVLKEGRTLVYEPNALVRHRHRRTYEQLRTQIYNNGAGLYSYLVRSALAYPEERYALFRLGSWWLWKGIARPLLVSLLRPTRLRPDLYMAELRGAFNSLNRYRQARQVAAEIENTFGRLDQVVRGDKPQSQESRLCSQESVAVRAVDINQPIPALADVTDYLKTRVFVTANDHPLAYLDIPNLRQTISSTRLRQAIVNKLNLKLLQGGRKQHRDLIWSQVMEAISHLCTPSEGKDDTGAPDWLPAHVPVSVVVATLDRPDDLRECLHCLINQRTSRPVEIVVVDNNPQSRLTPPVVAEFPKVVLVNEPRQGLAYARNAGFSASTGDILIATDDDVRIPPDWLEKLVAPFVRRDVMVVTGNVLPLELETAAQRHFENYGGLGRGFEPFEVGGEWFESFRRRAVPTWELGATANAAFRAAIFSHPRIGLMDEALGPGMPSGVGEDTYLFYKVLKAGYRLVYEPTAYVWHKHRRTTQALHRQIYNYSKGHVAYHLTTLLRDHDMRGLLHITYQLPRWHLKQLAWQVKDRLRGRKMDTSLSLTLLQIAGNLVGPWALWKSRRRVRREGHSQPYHPTPRQLRNSQDLALGQIHQSAAEQVGLR